MGCVVTLPLLACTNGGVRDSRRYQPPNGVEMLNRHTWEQRSNSHKLLVCSFQVYIAAGLVYCDAQCNIRCVDTGQG